MSSPTLPSRKLWIIPIALILLGGILRFAAARGELWLDEVWSLTMVRRLASPLEIFFKLRIDNNHHLNSLWLYFVPTEAPLIAYRLAAILSGVLTLAVAAALSASRGRGPMFGAVLCCAASYIMVHYSSEARGYAPLMLFLLLACWSRDRARRTDRTGWSLLYATSCILGFLSHIAFLQFFAPAATLDLISSIRGKTPNSFPTKKFTPLLLRIGIPSLFFSLFWLVSLRGMQIGGGNKADYLEIILETLAISIGIPASPTGTLLGAVIALFLLIAVIVHLWSISSDWALLFIGSAILMPALLLVLMGREDIYTRYFLIGIVFFQWALGDWLGSLLQSSTRKQFRPVAVVLLVLFVAANGIQDADLIRLGRSHYLEMLDDAARQSTSKPAYITADHPFRQGMMLGFYLPRSPAAEKVQLATQPAHKPEWVLVHGQDPVLDKQTSIDHPQLGSFTLTKKYPAAKLSGWNLYLYHKSP